MGGTEILGGCFGRLTGLKCVGLGKGWVVIDGTHTPHARHFTRVDLGLEFVCRVLCKRVVEYLAGVWVLLVVDRLGGEYTTLLAFY